MTKDEALQIFRDSGALLEGHFILRSGLHSRQFFQCALALQQMPVVEKLGAALEARDLPRNCRRAREGHPGLGGEPLASLRAARGENLAATDRRQTGTEAMTALADDLAGLIGALHGTTPATTFL